MSTKTQANLIKTSIGRIILHLSAIKRDHKIKWHLAGIKRELVA